METSSCVNDAILTIATVAVAWRLPELDRKQRRLESGGHSEEARPQVVELLRKVYSSIASLMRE